MEVTEPLELAGVRAVLREADWSLEYSDLCLNIGPLSAEQISPATVPGTDAQALREGWLLEENTEERQDIPCVRLALEQTRQRRRGHCDNNLAPAGGWNAVFGGDRRGGRNNFNSGVYELFIL